MKKVISLILVLISILHVSALADGIMPLNNPDDNINTPNSLPYQGFFNIKSYTATKAITGPSDRSITVTLTNAYFEYPVDKEVALTITAFYRTSGGGWDVASAKTIKISTTPDTYSVMLSVPANRTIYVKFTKGYTDYYAHANFIITD